MGIKQKFLKIRTGRIYPIVLTYKEESIIILGGNTTGDFNKSIFRRMNEWLFKPNPQILTHPNEILDFNTFADINATTNHSAFLLTLDYLN